MADLAVEVEAKDCLFCSFGEIPDRAIVPYPLCLKHMDILCFILDKANIPHSIEEAD